jgi:hypothetical protein
MFRQTAFRWLAIFLMIGGLIGWAMTAQADTSDDRKHCAKLLDPVQEGDQESKVTDLGCYKTFAEAIAAGTDGQVQLPADATTVAADVIGPHGILSIDYEFPFFSGRSVSWFGNGNCSGSRFFVLNFVGNRVNNAISSSDGGGSRCRRNIHFDGRNRTGAFRVCRSDCATLGRLDDRTSSKEWRR